MEQIPITIQFKTLPSDPGVYQYFDKNNTVIYVGKAKLKTQGNFLFTKTHDNTKTRILVKLPMDISWFPRECLLLTTWSKNTGPL